MMRNQLTIRAGRATIRGVPTPPDIEGLYVTQNGFTGWKGIPGRRREQVARAAEHGEFDVAVFLPGRAVTITGLAIGRSLERLEVLSTLVTGIGSAGGRELVEVDLNGQNLHGFGRVLSSTVEEGWEMREGHFVAPFEVQLVFADPRKYGDTEVFPTSGVARSMTVFQRGNFPSHPIVEIPDGPVNFSMTSPGGTFAYRGATAGGTIRIEMRRGRVTRNGIDITNLVTTSDLWAVPVGASWLHTLSAPGRVLLPETHI